MKKSLRVSLAMPGATALCALAGFAAIVGLSGCTTDKHITEVKALAFSYPDNNTPDPNLTVDQALDYRKVCDSVKWKVDMTEQHQTFVEYHCDYKGVDDSVFGERDKSNLASAEDVYQWTYNVNGQPELSYAGFTIHFKNGTSKDFKLNTTYVMELASKNKATNFDEAFSYLTNESIPVKPAMPFTDTTYGNTLATYYPGRSAVDAANLAYQWRRVPLELNGAVSVDELGYPGVSMRDESQLFPVNPADVQFAKKVDTRYLDYNADLSSNNPHEIIRVLQLAPKKLFCLNNICYDRNAWGVGRAPESVLAQEVELNKWVQISAITPAPKPGKEAADAPDALAAAMASTAMTPPTPVPADAPATPIPTTVATDTSSGDVAEGDWPKDTPCIKTLRDKFTTDQEKQNLDSSVSRDQMLEWADVCKSLGK